MGVEIEIPDLEKAVLEGLALIADKALAVAEDVQYILKDVAVLEEKDVYGEKIPPKKPRPAKSPKNLPNAQLIDTGNMLDPSRFVVTREGDFDAVVTYTPPPYFEYVIIKRPFMTPDAINDDARSRIEKKMREAMTE